LATVGHSGLAWVSASIAIESRHLSVGVVGG
jgi:hypothetical protein